jgi:hypothetical protein
LVARSRPLSSATSALRSPPEWQVGKLDKGLISLNHAFERYHHDFRESTRPPLGTRVKLPGSINWVMSYIKNMLTILNDARGGEDSNIGWIRELPSVLTHVN